MVLTTAVSSIPPIFKSFGYKVGFTVLFSDCGVICGKINKARFTGVIQFFRFTVAIAHVSISGTVGNQTSQQIMTFRFNKIMISKSPFWGSLVKNVTFYLLETTLKTAFDSQHIFRIWAMPGAGLQSPLDS